MWLYVWIGRFYKVRFEVPRSWPIIVDNANLMALANNMLIEGSFAPIFPIKIDIWWLAINENEDVFLKDFAFLRLYFRSAWYTVRNIFIDWTFKSKKVFIDWKSLQSSLVHFLDPPYWLEALCSKIKEMNETK